ncbi:MAG: cysteine synthase family protein [Deltaproteobacteria bacterium]|nr:cysteine synthase family protein [Deltaproteobacteria bacterium]
MLSMIPGKTPLVSVGAIRAKLECTNPCGSIKDRIAAYILRCSLAQGLLKPHQPIVEATSGNTGISLAYYARALGHPVTIIMPEQMTEERKKAIRDLGATLRLCSAAGSFAEAVAWRDTLVESKGYFSTDQFANPLNVACHRETTGQEILAQVGEGPVDCFVAGVGTGGTLLGVGRALRAVYPQIQVVAVEPTESAVLSGRPPGSHGIFGIGDGFIPPILCDAEGRLSREIDAVETVSTAEAIAAAQQIKETFGFCVGVSSGANFFVASRLARRFRQVVTIFPDGYYKYRSQGLVHCASARCPYEHPRDGVIRELAST